MTLFEHISAARPESIFDICDERIFIERDDEKMRDYIRGKNHYEWKAAVSTVLAPESILEIGVRYGYSLAAFLAGAPGCLYAEGWDNCCYDANSNQIAARGLALLKRKVRLFNRNSIEVDEYETHFDFVHIDGSHNYAVCSHDLLFAMNHGAKAVLVDDYDTCDDDRRACRDFAKANAERIADTLHLPTVHGDFLIVFKP